MMLKKIKTLEKKVESQALILRALCDLVRDLNNTVKELENGDKVLRHTEIQGKKSD